MTGTSNKKKKTKRPNELALKRSLVFGKSREVTLELPIQPPSQAPDLDEEPYTKYGRVNSARDMPRYEDTMDRELNNISVNQVPVPPGSYVTDYDGIQMTLARLSQAFIAVRTRLEWCGYTIRAQEIEIHEKKLQLSKLDPKHHEMPDELRKVPFYDEPTVPGKLMMVTYSVVNRAGMIAAGIVSAAFMLMTFYKLLFG